MQTPEAFVRACDLFVYTENLVKPQAPAETKTAGRKRARPPAEKTAAESQPAAEEAASRKEDRTAEARSLASQAFYMVMQDDGWATLPTWEKR